MFQNLEQGTHGSEAPTPGTVDPVSLHDYFRGTTSLGCDTGKRFLKIFISQKGRNNLIKYKAYTLEIKEIRKWKEKKEKLFLKKGGMGLWD